MGGFPKIGVPNWGVCIWGHETRGKQLFTPQGISAALVVRKWAFASARATACNGISCGAWRSTDKNPKLSTSSPREPSKRMGPETYRRQLELPTMVLSLPAPRVPRSLFNLICEGSLAKGYELLAAGATRTGLPAGCSPRTKRWFLVKCEASQRVLEQQPGRFHLRPSSLRSAAIVLLPLARACTMRNASQPSPSQPQPQHWIVPHSS